ncbi:MAG TPA: SUF system NifU family Fe-S cluster assembly protein [Candidatus Acidoferrales bacterium]|nr:SUF system NifU family Fe-S cluster assembly protein [Candidatus Acidoferrales bacterium]
MSDLRDLYQELILEHSKAPRNFRAVPDASLHAEGYNPLCGDHFTVYLQMEGDSIRDVAFQGAGCAISKASASMMTQTVKGKTKTEAEEIFHRFHELVTNQPSANGASKGDDLGKLAVFAGVRDYPVRVKCATLAWHTLHAALEGSQQPVSTE